jgi:hypothetical protein
LQSFVLFQACGNDGRRLEAAGQNIDHGPHLSRIGHGGAIPFAAESDISSLALDPLLKKYIARDRLVEIAP